MTEYLLIESRSPSESGDVAQSYALAGAALAAHGEHLLTLLLVAERRVARDAARAPKAWSPPIRAGVTVLADDFSLRGAWHPARSTRDAHRARAARDRHEFHRLADERQDPVELTGAQRCRRRP